MTTGPLTSYNSAPNLQSPGSIKKRDKLELGRYDALASQTESKTREIEVFTQFLETLKKSPPDLRLSNHVKSPKYNVRHAALISALARSIESEKTPIEETIGDWKSVLADLKENTKSKLAGRRIRTVSLSGVLNLVDPTAEKAAKLTRRHSR